jgi:hypothetical protein
MTNTTTREATTRMLVALASIALSLGSPEAAVLRALSERDEDAIRTLVASAATKAHDERLEREAARARKGCDNLPHGQGLSAVV